MLPVVNIITCLLKYQSELKSIYLRHSGVAGAQWPVGMVHTTDVRFSIKMFCHCAFDDDYS